MTEEIVNLNAPDRSPVPKVVPELFMGRAYAIKAQQLADDAHGLCGGFLNNAKQGGAQPVEATSTRVFLWDHLGESTEASFTLPGGEKRIDVNSNTSIGGAQFTLSNAFLTKPQIVADDKQRALRFSVDFEFLFSADHGSASLGVLHLVNSSRFLDLADEKRVILSESDEDSPRLYLENPVLQNEAVKIIAEAQMESFSDVKTYEQCISHIVPQDVDGIPVETITVLEQYQSYFMQRELPFAEENIWTPVCPPISWGWSIRINRRADGEQVITRQKLLNPVVGHDGLEMPSWGEED